ncbi:hypothetical protein JST56_03950 [Candidatus Dependentiae bacterium]|nr:hypothetical protein [Candidatus Dependentiae bacterium]
MSISRFLSFVVTIISLFSVLQAQQEIFNVNDQGHTSIDQCALSPDGTMLAVKHDYSPITTLWNVQTRTVYSQFETHGRLFFSSDSKRLYACSNKVITGYKVTTGNVKVLYEKHHNKKFFDIESSLPISCTEISGNFKQFYVNTRLRCQNSAISTLSPNFDATWQWINYSVSPYDSFETCLACCINPQATRIAFIIRNGHPALPECKTYILIADLTQREHKPGNTNIDITERYLVDLNFVKSINFSPDTTKLVTNNNFATVIFDLTTNWIYSLRQKDSVKYTAFVDNSTVLSVLFDGAVILNSVSDELLCQYQNKHKERFL